MTNLEAGLRGGGIALCLLLALLRWRDARNVPAGRYGVLFALCGVAYLIEAAPEFAHRCPLWVIPLRLLSNSTPGIFYLWAAAHFDDDFTPHWSKWLPWLAMLGVSAWAIATTGTWYAWRVVQVTALVIVAFGVWEALAGRAGDLIEGRRRFRLVLAIGIAGFIAALNLLGFVVPSVNLAVGATAPAVLLALAMAAAFLAFELRVPTEPVPVVTGTSPVSPRSVGSTSPPHAEEAALLTRLRQLMERDKVYREEGLGIAALANRLGLPEYRLRRLINQRLGHRNFSSFVNGYRLSEAATALADPTQVAVPVLTIALDAGFQSIGPFNRAFKAHTGMTPSEYRREHLGRLPPRAAE